MIGWLKLHRKLLDSNMYKSLNSKQRDVLFTCLMLTNHTENEWEFDGKIYKCESGQFVTSLDSIAKNCGKDVKVQSVRTALLKLEKWGFLTNKSTKTGRLITICKWAAYQQKDEVPNNAANKDLTKSQQRANKDLTPNKNVKKDKNVNNEEEDINATPAFSFRKELLSLCNDKLIIDTFLKIRKKKKATNSEIAFNSIKKEIDKSNLGAKKCLEICCEKSWGSFKFEWLENAGYLQKPTQKQNDPRKHKDNPEVKYTKKI